MVARRVGWAVLLIGYGISLHDFAHQVWELKGTVLSLEGGYIGFILMLVGIAVLLLNSWDSLMRKL